MRTTRVTSALAVLVTAALLPGTAYAAAPVGAAPGVGQEARPGVGQAAQPPATGVLAQAHTAGRVKVDGEAVRHGWPGVYFEARFRGDGVGMVINDSAGDYIVEIDGEVVDTLVTPGRITHWVGGLADGEHTVRLVQRSETQGSSGEFGGFVPTEGGVILDKPAPRTRQIEFIGDSYTAGYGNMSNNRECTDAEVRRNTNADASFGALTARKLDADYQLNAFSGRGMVRNYNGIEPNTSFRTYYDRALPAVSGDVWERPETWQPQLIVIGLGINDFSTALNAGERWANDAALRADYKTAYHGFLDKLREQYGPDPVIVVSATFMDNSTAFRELAEQVAAERNSAGDDRIRYWYYPDTGFDKMGCHWHPSAADHRLISERLDTFIADLALDW